MPSLDGAMCDPDHPGGKLGPLWPRKAVVSWPGKTAQGSPMTRNGGNMKDVVAMADRQWKIITDLQSALEKTACGGDAENKSEKASELARALESSMNVWRMLKDLCP